MEKNSLNKLNTANDEINIFTNSMNKIITPKERHQKQDFFSLDMFSGKIVSKVDFSSKGFNDLSITNIGEKYYTYLKSKNFLNKSFLIISNNNLDSQVYSQIFASSLKKKDIKVFFASNNESINLATSFSNIDESFGGVVYFSFNKNKENILSINFYNNDGTFLSIEDSKIFNNFYNTTELNLEIYDEKVPILENFNIDKYISNFPTSVDLSNITISINNNGNIDSNLINNFFNRNNIKYNELKKQTYKQNKNAKKIIFNAMLNKSDVAINMFDNNNSFELAIRHKNYYKFFDLNDLVAIYLHYEIRYNEKNKNYFNDKYIVKNISSGDLVSIIAQKNNIKIKEYLNFYSDISNNKDLSSEMLLAIGGKNFFLTKGQNNYISDPLRNLHIFLNIISFFKKQNKNLVDVMAEINSEYGIYRHSMNIQTMDDSTSKKFINLLYKDLRFINQKIIRIKNIKIENKNFKIIKIILQDKTKITFMYSEQSHIMKTYISLYLEPKKEEPIFKTKKINFNSENNGYIDLVVKEKKIIEAIKIFNEDFSKKKTGFYDLLKYFIFISIFIGIFILLFSTIYNGPQGPFAIFTELNSLIKSNNLLMYLLPLLLILMMVPILFNSILIGRMLYIQGKKVKIRHLVIASSIGIVVSSITPMSIGGDIASYWYLKRKSFERESLMATFLASSFLYQLVGAIQSIIFIPIGIILYKDFFLSGSPVSASTFILVLVGFFSNVIAAVSIGIFSFSKRSQSWFIRSWMGFIEWNPLILSRDPSSKAATFQYSFMKIRNSSKLIFKNIGVTSEFILWRTLPFFFNLPAILAIVSGMMKPNDQLWGGQYLSFIIGNAMVNSANVISITPGGSGTSEVFKVIMYNEIFRNDFTLNGLTYTSYQLSTLFSLFSSLIFFIIPTIISGFLLLTVWIGEKRIDKYKKIKRIIAYESVKFQNKNIRKYTRFQKIASGFWVLGIVMAITTYYLTYSLSM